LGRLLLYFLGHWIVVTSRHDYPWLLADFMSSAMGVDKCMRISPNFWASPYTNIYILNFYCICENEKRTQSWCWLALKEHNFFKNSSTLIQAVCLNLYLNIYLNVGMKQVYRDSRNSKMGRKKTWNVTSATTRRPLAPLSLQCTMPGHIIDVGANHIAMLLPQFSSS
jgi:hypothetical protein